MALVVVAAAIALALAGVAIVTLQEHGVLPGRSITDSGTATSPPPYIVTIDGSDAVQVQSTATGKVTDRLGPPAEVSSFELNRAAVVAAPDLDCSRSLTARRASRSASTLSG